MTSDPMTSLQELFARHNLRCTRQRLAIYQALIAAENHPTADELYRIVVGRTEGLSLATIYNTLEAFCRAGLAQKIPAPGCARYNAGNSDHLHVRCERTGEVKDVPHDLSRKLLARITQQALDEIEKQLNFKIGHVNIELVGEYFHKSAQAAEQKAGAAK